MADKYFIETVINGGSILRPLSAQPILRKGGCSAVLCKGRHTCSLRSADKDESRMSRRRKKRESAVYHDISSTLSSRQHSPSHAQTGEARMLLLCTSITQSVIIRRLNAPQKSFLCVHLREVCGFMAFLV